MPCAAWLRSYRTQQQTSGRQIGMPPLTPISPFLSSLPSQTPLSRRARLMEKVYCFVVRRIGSCWDTPLRLPLFKMPHDDVEHMRHAKVWRPAWIPCLIATTPPLPSPFFFPHPTPSPLHCVAESSEKTLPISNANDEVVPRNQICRVASAPEKYIVFPFLHREREWDRD
jgi:hypothetical protein